MLVCKGVNLYIVTRRIAMQKYDDVPRRNVRYQHSSNYLGPRTLFCIVNYAQIKVFSVIIFRH